MCLFEFSFPVFKFLFQAWLVTYRPAHETVSTQELAIGLHSPISFVTRTLSYSAPSFGIARLVGVCRWIFNT